MRNIPDFTCEYGAAQLILENIDRGGGAYCLILWAVEGGLMSLLAECSRFCRMVGAERISALLPENLPQREKRPQKLSFRVLEMAAPKAALGSTDAALWPVLPENAGAYIRRYNEAMIAVDGARRLWERDIPGLLEKGGCYFVHRDGQLLGLGQVLGERVVSVVAAVPGGGAETVRALTSVITGDTVRLSVADSNERAMRLYARLGFTPARVLETWWDISAAFRRQ